MFTSGNWIWILSHKMCQILPSVCLRHNWILRFCDLLHILPHEFPQNWGLLLILPQILPCDLLHILPLDFLQNWGLSFYPRYISMQFTSRFPSELRPTSDLTLWFTSYFTSWFTSELRPTSHFTSVFISDILPCNLLYILPYRDFPQDSSLPLILPQCLLFTSD